MTKAQRKWLASYDPKTGGLSVGAGRICGYDDLIRMNYVAEGGPKSPPKLFITAKGLIYLERNPDAASSISG
jgi:hypothetical protein